MAETRTGPTASLLSASIMRREPRSENASTKAATSTAEEKTRSELFSRIKEHAEGIQKLAEQYGKNQTEELRKEINRESLHLHGEVQVLSKYMDPDGKERLYDEEIKANKSIEEAAGKWNRVVEHVHIEDIKTRGGDNASNHLHTVLQGSKTEHEYISSVEEEVLKELQKLHGKSHGNEAEAEEMLRRIFSFKSLSREEEPKVATPPAELIQGNNARENTPTNAPVVNKVVETAAPKETAAIEQRIITFSGVTDEGLKKKVNQDSILMKEFSAEVDGVKVHRSILAVADGIGGGVAGDIASSMVIEEASRVLGEIAEKQEKLSESDIMIQFGKLFLGAQSKMDAYAKDHALGERYIGTTLSLAFIDGDMLHIGHIGDSKIYKLGKDGALTQLTINHEDPTSRGKPLTKAFFSGNKGAPDLLEPIKLEKGEKLILCTDGLENYKVADEVIRQVALRYGENTKAACEELISIAKDNGGSDNISVIIANVD